MKSKLLEAQDKHDREIRRLGRKALKERQNDEWLKELIATGVGKKLLDHISADRLESMGKTFARRARKEQKKAEACFLMARCKRRREVTDGN